MMGVKPHSTRKLLTERSEVPHRLPTVNLYHLIGDPVGLLGTEEGAGVGDILGLTATAQWDTLVKLFLCIRCDVGGLTRSHRSGGYSVHSNIVR